MKFIFFNIKINIRNIIVDLKDNNFFYFRMWKERKSTIISFNFESSMIMLMSKQYNIKFVMMRKLFNIKLALFYIIFKNDIIDKERFNSIDKLIFKPQYFDIFFDSKSTFDFNSDVSRKINVNILNL